MMTKIMVIHLKGFTILTNFLNWYLRVLKSLSFSFLFSLLFLAFVPFLNSCSSYVEYLESNNSIEREQYFSKEESQKFCSSNGGINIIYKSPKQVSEFKSIQEQLPQKMKLSDIGLLYTIYQSLIRPDSSNWNGRFQFLIKQNGKFSYFDFHSTDLNFPKAVQTLHQSKISTYRLKELMGLVKKYFPKKLTVHEDFSEFLSVLNSKLSEEQKKKYYRLGKPLQKGETFLYKLALHIKTPKSSYSEPPLFERTSEEMKPNKASCNFDISLYDSGIFLIRDQEINENVFALTSDNGDYFIAATSSGPVTKVISPLYLSQIETPQFNIPFCRYSDSQKEQVFLAFGQRDSGQILDHLFDYGIHKSKSIYEASEYINYARHIFLTNPSRLLYESQRGSQEEMNSFLSLDFPVYHVKNLGRVYSFLTYKGKPPLFLRDIRAEAAQSCLK